MFYIFHGDDAHSQKEFLAKLQTRLGDPAMLDLNTTRLEGHLTLADFQQACDAMPFLAPARLVLVQDFFKGKPDKDMLADLLAYLPHLPETTRLVFLESAALSANHKALKLAEQDEQGFARQFNRPEGNQLEKWIRQRVADKDGRISSHAAHILAVNVGSQLDILENEIEKLVVYAGDEEIGINTIGLLSPYAAEASIFDLVDAMGNRNGKRTAVLLQQKLNEGTEPFYLFSMIVRQFRLLIQVKELADAGERPPSIGKILKLHSFVAGKLFQQSANFSQEQLEQIYRHLLEIDVGVKTGKNEMITALNLLVGGLAQPL